jgi:hypothetical protein
MGIIFSRTFNEPNDPSIPGHIFRPIHHIEPTHHHGSIASESHEPVVHHHLPPPPTGAPLPMPVTPERENDHARMKLQSHQVKPFNGHSTEFPKWKVHTECVFNGTGYERVLTNKTYARKHPNKNTLVYSQLSIALCDGDASHLVDQHKNTQDGHQAWQDVLTFFHGSKLSIRTARVIRSKLSRLTLTEGMSAASYINKFQTWHRDLSDINDGAEGFSDDTKIQAFLDNIKHPRYLMTVGCIKNIIDLDMDIAIDRIRQTETELETERGEKRKMNVLRRQIYIEDGFRPPEEDDSPADDRTPGTLRAKKRRRIESKNTNLPKDINLKASGTIAIKEGWTELLQSDKDFVCNWNSRARHGESTKDIQIPTGVTLHPFAGSGNIKRLRRQIQEAKGKTAAMQKADKKRIHFNLPTGDDDDYDDDEIEDVDPHMN